MKTTKAQTVSEILRNTKGWLTLREGLFLFDAAKRIPFGGGIVEIGSWKGRSTLCLAEGTAAGHCARVYAVDPHTGSSEHTQGGKIKVDTYREFIRNTKRFCDLGIVIPERKTSQEAAKNGTGGNVCLLFIDGAHELEFVKLDLELWLPRMHPGGTVALHDSWHFPGVQIASAQVLLTSREVRKPRLVDTITYFETCRRNTLPERIENALFVIRRFLTGWIGFHRLKYTGANP